MSRIERYVFRTATTAFLSGLVVLTGVIWITQALRQIDLLTSKGQTILIFLMMTGLALPSLVAIIAPVALFAGVLYTLNKLNGDSELVVMAAAGVSPARLLRPLALLSATGVRDRGGDLHSGPALELRRDREPDDLRSRRLHLEFRPSGRFLRARGWASSFIIASARPTARCAAFSCRTAAILPRSSTYIAEAGKTVDRDGASYLQLSKGVLLRPQSAGDSSMVTFDDYTVDLSQFIHALSSIKRPRERTTAQLMAPTAQDRSDPALVGHIRSELLDRLASPLYAFVGGLIAFAALGEARTTRQGRGVAIGGAILAFFGLRMLGIAATTLDRRRSVRGAIFVWVVPLAACLGALALVLRRLIAVRARPVQMSPA